MPPVVHQTLDLNGIDQDGRLIVVGDVHGCLDQLVALLKEVKYKHSKDCLVFVGDLVNRGPSSCKVSFFLSLRLNSFQTLSCAMEYKALCVRGNHDDTVLRDYRNLLAGKPIINEWVRNMTEEQALYIEKMPFSLSIPELKTIIVHAGLVPGISLKEQNLDAMYNMRFLRMVDWKWEALSTQTTNCILWSHAWTGRLCFLKPM